jgi:hypothetical protein
MRAGLVLHLEAEESPGRSTRTDHAGVLPRPAGHGHDGVFRVAAGHREQVPDRHRGQVVADLLRQVVLAEERDDLVVERQLAVGDQQSDPDRGEALRHREQQMPVLEPVRRPLLGQHHLPVALQHHRVDLLLGSVERGDERVQRVGG